MFLVYILNAFVGLLQLIFYPLSWLFNKIDDTTLVESVNDSMTFFFKTVNGLVVEFPFMATPLRLTIAYFVLMLAFYLFGWLLWIVERIRG